MVYCIFLKNGKLSTTTYQSYIVLAIVTLGNIKFGDGIFDGWYAEPGEYPFAVCFIIGDKYPQCGGMIVTNDKIITVADCLNNDYSDFRVVAGVVDITDVNAKEYQISKLSKKELHPKYELRGPKKVSIYNIALGVLETPFKYTDHVKPLVLVSSNKDTMEAHYYSYAGNKKECVTFGWGSTVNDYTVPDQPIGKKPSMKLKIVGIMPELYDECPDMSNGLNYDLRTIGFVCACPIEPNATLCNSDGGAGIICGPRKHAYAIATETFVCGNNAPSVFLLLSYFIEMYGMQENADYSCGISLTCISNQLLELSVCFLFWYFQQPYY